MTEDFRELQQLIRDGRAVIGLNKHLVWPTFVDCLNYKRPALFWALGVISLPFNWWLCLPISLLLAWRFASWWLILLGIVLPFVAAAIENELGIRYVQNSASADEDIFDYLWSLPDSRIRISSTRMETRAESLGVLPNDNSVLEDPDYYGAQQSKVFIFPPSDWRKEIAAKAQDF